MDDLAAVVFDLDGTLCVDDQDFADLWAAAFERAGVDPVVVPEDVAAVDPVVPSGGAAAGDDDASSPAESRASFYERLFMRAVADAGGDPDRETAARVAAAYRDVRDPTAISFRPGAREALANARERYSIGLVTNGGPDVQGAKLDALGVRDAFDVAVYCHPDDGVTPKPDPAPFRRAVDDLGVGPDAALHVGDTLAEDVAGAREAGLRTAWVPREAGPPDPEPAPTYVLDSMAEVAGLLREG